jgi:hypothetical protein
MIDDASASFANTLRRAIRRMGRSSYAVAAASGVCQPVLSRFLSGKRTITLETAEKLCRFLGWSLGPPDLASADRQTSDLR